VSETFNVMYSELLHVDPRIVMFALVVSDADFGLSLAGAGVGAAGGAAGRAGAARAAPPLPYTFSEEPADVVVRRNGSAELRCGARLADGALNKSLTFWWTLDGARIPLPDPTRRLKLLPFGNLLIHKVGQGLIGRCTVIF